MAKRQRRLLHERRLNDTPGTVTTSSRAAGTGASARKSLGIAVASGMLASTCLAVLFVPAFYVVLQKFAERKQGAKDSNNG